MTCSMQQPIPSTHKQRRSAHLRLLRRGRSAVAVAGGRRGSGAALRRRHVLPTARVRQDGRICALPGIVRRPGSTHRGRRVAARPKGGRLADGRRHGGRLLRLLRLLPLLHVHGSQLGGSTVRLLRRLLAQVLNQIVPTSGKRRGKQSVGAHWRGGGGKWTSRPGVCKAGMPCSAGSPSAIPACQHRW